MLTYYMPPQTMWSNLSKETLRIYLNQAQQAYNDLLIGNKPISVSYSQEIGANSVTYSQATASITSDGKGNHFLSLSIPQGRAGNDGISPTLSIGTVATYDPDQKATADIVHNSDGKDILNLGLVKGDKGDTGAQESQARKGILAHRVSLVHKVKATRMMGLLV